MLCLENLAIYLDFVACCYSSQYQEHPFDKTVITARIEKAKQSKQEADAAREEFIKQQEKVEQQELSLKKLMEENASLKEKLSKRRTRSSRATMFQNHWICQSIKPGNFI